MHQLVKKNWLAIMYRLPISLWKTEIYRLSVSPRAFLKLLEYRYRFIAKRLIVPITAFWAMRLIKSVAWDKRWKYRFYDDHNIAVVRLILISLLCPWSLASR